MKIKIFLKENNSFMGDFNVRKNCKNINEKAKEYIEKYYNCKIRRSIPTGKIDFENKTTDISYILFGDNLPFRNYYLIKEE